MKRVLFISSAGGHLEQLLTLKSTMDYFESSIVTEKNAATESLKEKLDNVFFLPFFSRKNKLLFPIVFLRIVFLSAVLLIKLKPKVIVSTGAGVTVPICFLGKLSGKKIVYIETFSRMESQTLSGRLCYRIADRFIIQWESLKKFYPDALLFGSVY